MVTKRLIDIPDELMAEARAALGLDVTKADTVRTALIEPVRRHRQREALGFFTKTDVVADLRDPEVRSAARR